MSLYVSLVKLGIGTGLFSLVELGILAIKLLSRPTRNRGPVSLYVSLVELGIGTDLFSLAKLEIPVTFTRNRLILHHRWTSTVAPLGQPY